MSVETKKCTTEEAKKAGRYQSLNKKNSGGKLQLIQKAIQA